MAIEIDQCIRGFDQLVDREEIYVDDFLELVGYVTSMDILKELVERRPIRYADKNNDEYSFAHNLTYGSALDTHNRGYGVCDELSVYVLPFLLNIEEVSDIHLIRCEGIYVPDLNNVSEFEDNASHSFVVYKLSDKWHYINNLKFSDQAFTSLRKAANHAANITGFVEKVDFDKREVNKLGSWVYDGEISKYLQPVQEL